MWMQRFYRRLQLHQIHSAEMRHPSYCHMWKWTRVLGALSLPQSSTAMLVTGAQQHQLQELPPATPSCSAGLQCLKDQEAEVPGRHTGKRPSQGGEWLGEHSHCGLLERSSRERGAVWWQSSNYWLVMVCGPTCGRGGWKKSLQGLRICLWCEHVRIRQEDSPELEEDWTFVVPGMQCWVAAVVEVGCRSV